MIRQWDLSEHSWTLRGWRQHDWERSTNAVRLDDGQPDVPAVPMRVPGSVRAALVQAGIVPSPYHGTDSRASEWIENRHWTLTTELTDEQRAAVAAGQRLALRAEALDHAGVVLVDGTTAGRFRGAAVPTEVDLTDAVAAGGRTLTIVFTDLPDGLGQIGRTSQVRDFKARFQYGWDWTPRIVQIGVVGPVELVARSGVTVADVVVIGEPTDDPTLSVRARLRRTDSGTDPAHAATDPDTDGAPAGSAVEGTVTVRVTGPGVDLVAEVPADGTAHALPVPGAAPWTTAHPTLYDVEISGPDGDVVRRRVGFRSLRWLPCTGAPEGALPWILELAGEPVFLAGVNWVPIRPDHADVTADDYRRRLLAYREIGVVLLRVWGGALIEQPVFYDLADELGLLVWQELPLSSSGLDNTPPDDAPFAQEFAEIADSYAHRLAHHPCLVQWGGGNELTEQPVGDEIPPPLRDGHPAIVAARDAVAAVDPTRRFVTTSPTGPSMFGLPETRGLGLHHDVHGPWETTQTAQEWQEYWDHDDALLRSEVGMGGASDLDLLTEFGMVGPTDTAQERDALAQLWRHSSAWWLVRFRQWDGTGGLAAWVEQDQRRQAEFLGAAAAATRRRFPAVGGFVVWLGHDTFPCAVSLSVLDFHGRPKPVAAALRAAFTGDSTVPGAEDPGNR